MKVVVPVAGSGTRLRPHTYSQPKSLLFVGDKPILAHLLDPIVKLDPDEVIFVVGYKGDEIKEFVAANYTFPTRFVKQDQLLGLGYALHQAIKEIDQGELLIILGDTIVETDLSRFVAEGENVLGVLEVDDPQRFGIVSIDNGQVVKLTEKPKKPESNLAIIGLYYFKDVAPLQAALADHVASGKTTKGEIQFTDALQLMIERGANFVAAPVKEWFDCGKKETMLSTNRHLVAAAGNNPNIAGCRITPPVYIHPNAIVENSDIGPAVSIGEGSSVSNSRLQNCIVGHNSTIDGATLRDSLIGNDVKLSGGNLVANLGDSSELHSD